MKKLIYIIAVAVIMVLAIPMASFAHGHHGCGSSFSVGVSFGTPVVYQPAPVVVYTPPVVYRTAVVEPVVMPTGHWETRIVRYETVVEEVYHPPVYDWSWNGTAWEQYIAGVSYTEKVYKQQPVYGQVWVQDVQQVVVTQAPVVYSSCSSSFGFSGTIH